MAKGLSSKGDQLPALAAGLLVSLVVLAPWPFGGAHPSTTAGIAMISLAAAAVLCLYSLGRPSAAAPGRFTAPALLALWPLAIVQLVPLPRAVHQLLAPGSAALWYPSNPVAAAVLGGGPRPLSIAPEATLRAAVFATAVLGLALLAAPALRSRAALLRAATIVVAGGCAVAIYAFVARLAFGDRLFGVLTVPTIAPFGSFVSKNHFAGYVEMAACLALGLAAGLADEARRGRGWLGWLESRRSAWIVAAWGAAAVLVAAVPVSLSRGGVLSVCAGLFAFIGIRLAAARSHEPQLRRSAPRWRLLLGVAVVAVVGVLGAAVLVLPDDARARLRTLAAPAEAGAYRLATWHDSLSLAASSPIVGSGFGSYADALPRFKTSAGELRVEHAENDYLELLAEGGLVAGVLVALALGSLAAAAWRGVRGEPHRLSRGVRAGALAGLAAIAVHSLFDFNLRIPSNALLASFLLGCVMAPVSIARRPVDAGEPVPRGGSRWNIAFAVILGTTTLALPFVAWTEPRLASGALTRATGAATADGSSPLRKSRLESDVVGHLRTRPADPAAWLALAWLRLPQSRSEAASLVQWAYTLDPLHTGLRRGGDPIVTAAKSAPAAVASTTRR